MPAQAWSEGLCSDGCRSARFSPAAAGLAERCREIDEAWPEAGLNKQRRLMRWLVVELHHAYVGYTGEVLDVSMKTILEALDCLQQGLPHVLFALGSSQKNAEDRQRRRPDATTRMKGMAAAVLEYCSRVQPRTQDSYAKKICAVLHKNGMPGPGTRSSYGPDSVKGWLEQCIVVSGPAPETPTQIPKTPRADYVPAPATPRHHYLRWSSILKDHRPSAAKAIERLAVECKLEFGGS